MAGAFFYRDGDWIIGNDGALGPWSEDSCHAGPVTAIIAGAAEALVPDRQLVRLTVNYVRPVPMRGFRIEAVPDGSGGTAASTAVSAFDRDNKLLATARCLHLKVRDISNPPTSNQAAPVLSEASIGDFPVRQALHDKRFFGTEIEVAYPPGEDNEPGPTTIWMRTPTIVYGEEPTAFQTACPLADCANGFARNAEFVDVTCVNPDLTVLLHRPPESEWLASSGVSYWEPTGIGSTTATLYDERGAIGAALQSLVIRPVL